MNARAIKAYQTAHFKECFRTYTDGDDGVEYISMMLKLADAPLGA